MKKLSARLLAAALAIALLAGCSQAATDEASEAPPVSGDAATSTASAGGEEMSDEPVTLTMLHYKETFQPAFEELAAAFTEKYPNVTVTVEMATQDYNSVLTTRDAAGNMPDIWAMSNPGELGLAPWLESDKIVPVDDFGALTHLPADYMEQLQIDGTSYFVPYLTTARVMVYNEELLSAAGWDEPPATLSEMEECAADLQANGIIPFAIGASEVSPLGNGLFLPAWDKLTDLDWLNGMNEGISSFSAVEEFFPFYDMFIANTSEDAATMEHSAAMALMATEEAAITINGPWTVTMINELDPAVAQKLRAAPAPYFENEEDNQILYDYDTYFCVSNGPNVDWADTFLEFMVSDPTALEIFANSGKSINPYGMEYELLPVEEDIQALLDSGDFFVGENFQNMPTGFQREYALALQEYMMADGSMSPEDVYSTLDAKWAEYLTV